MQLYVWNKDVQIDTLELLWPVSRRVAWLLTKRCIYNKDVQTDMLKGTTLTCIPSRCRRCFQGSFYSWFEEWQFLDPVHTIHQFTYIYACIHTYVHTHRYMYEQESPVHVQIVHICEINLILERCKQLAFSIKMTRIHMHIYICVCVCEK